jgi:predicted 3-demethylubiquinone-9 3-methyltransferase (glyoxalase superfamily)
MNNQRIAPHLWFDKEAKEAADFYVSLFDNSKVTHFDVMKDTPSGDTEVVSFEIDGQPFMAISAGPLFKFNPSISFILNYDPSRFPDAKERIDAAWAKLSEGGTVRMPLQEYPFSKWYGWIEDRYGISWQLMLTNPGGEPRPFVTPALMFTGVNAGRAEEAITFYCSVFEDGKIGNMFRYPAGADEGTLMYSDFLIHNTWLAAMDSSGPHNFTFNEAISLLVPCDTQEEMDYYSDKLSAVPEAEQCGWLKDMFGLSWQIWPTDMGKMLSEGTPEQKERVTQAFLKMKRFDLAALRAAYEDV